MWIHRGRQLGSHFGGKCLRLISRSVSASVYDSWGAESRPLNRTEDDCSAIISDQIDACTAEPAGCIHIEHRVLEKQAVTVRHINRS